MITKTDLVDIVASYSPSLAMSDRARLELAYSFAQKKHEGQKREDGSDYFLHPLTVALVCAEQYEMDVDAVIAALLHDIVEDTDVVPATIEGLFGASVAELVKGLTKLRLLNIKSAKVQAENYRNFVIAAAKDIRVLIIKLVDRHHNIQTLHFIPDVDRRRRIASETMLVYVPLAERIGMDNIKMEMENICFKELQPQEHHFVSEKLESLKRAGEALITPIVSELVQLAFKHKIKVQVFGREKSPYSIWYKMQAKNKTFDEIFDIVAFRFIVESVEDCYKVLGMIHSTFKLVPNRFKDYISRPKPNKYQSLHTTVIGPGGKRVEIQIRTIEMDRVAQYGYAAHWTYKEGKRDIQSGDFMWLRNVLDSIKGASAPSEIIEKTQLVPYLNSIFCFTPTGDLVALPLGSTALDFAYEIHSSIGNSCSGAKINKVIKNIRTELKTGDEVEILTSKNQTPSPEWERYVVSSKAKSAIRKFLKTRERDSTIAYGRQLVAVAFEAYRKTLRARDLDPILGKFAANSEDELFLLVGSREITSESVLAALYPEFAESRRKKEPVREVRKRPLEFARAESFANIPIYFARCCCPVPGDEICGVVHTGKGISVHKAACRTLDRYRGEAGKVFGISWDDCNMLESSSFSTKISVMSSYEVGALNEITMVLAKSHALIDDIKVATKTSDFIEFLITINVKNVEHLNQVIAGLKTVKIINTVLKAS
ncbi:MAG: bifunctional (p)ppGpp synthetase/guanosine-3',5'-bis(diphosphate) 3'-pyrophosphohydrolase [Rickettsiales bacterium]|jgi:GTP pyrophosphokinase|nr:bifunctional (p)ppGpp synthetase/guanosine-3',5'-bis(diphosphate) 3'-pyrophosphohydrolase [Rickettsiales bacterium]